MLLVPRTFKWKNSDSRTGSTISSPLSVLVNKLLLAEIHTLSVYVLSMAHAALLKLNSVVTTENCVSQV